MTTKGKWWVEEGDFGYTIKAEQSIINGFDEDNDVEIAEINTYLDNEGEPKANAQLIVATVNACIKLNPDNPQAVADSISDLYEELKKADGLICHLCKMSMEDTLDCEACDDRKLRLKALAKAEQDVL